MATGLIALLDDIAALAKVAAASLDDAGAQAAKVGAKATGIVIDDAAVTPRYVVGLHPSRELPIIAKIARGSIINKVVFLLPAALILSAFAPWIITPLLMIGGCFLCYEGWHKVVDFTNPHAAHAEKDALEAAMTPEEIEDERVDSAIRTDFILSAEIMAISLAAIATSPIWLQGIVLFAVAVGMTALVYGAVALIVKADDVGVALARSKAGAIAALGRGIVKGMPPFLKALSIVGMLAMLWVGGGILIHGLAGLGFAGPEHLFHDWAEAVAGALPVAQGFVTWLVTAALSGVVGVAVGAVVAPLADRVIGPLYLRLKARFKKAEPAAG